MIMQAEDVARLICSSSLTHSRNTIEGKVELIDPEFTRLSQPAKSRFLKQVLISLINIEKRTKLRDTSNVINDIDFEWLKERVMQLQDVFEADVASCMYMILPISLMMNPGERWNLYYRLVREIAEIRENSRRS